MKLGVLVLVLVLVRLFAPSRSAGRRGTQELPAAMEEG